jgi:hypothetical protein
MRTALAFSVAHKAMGIAKQPSGTHWSTSECGVKAIDRLNTAIHTTRPYIHHHDPKRDSLCKFLRSRLQIAISFQVKEAQHFQNPKILKYEPVIV